MQQLGVSQLLTPERNYQYSRSPSAEEDQSEDSSPRIINSKFQTSNQQNHDNGQLQHLYDNVCNKQLSSKDLLKHIKNAHHISIETSYHKSNPQDVSQKETYQSLQQQITLSNYKKLLSNQYDSSFIKDKSLKHLELKHNTTKNQNQDLRQQNQRLRRAVVELKVKETKNERRYEQLQKKYRQMDRNYSNLMKESIAKEFRAKGQLKKANSEKEKYEKLMKGIKESIRILRGREVEDLSQIWKEWKSIFELASMQQCKLNKSKKKL